ncbi:MAG: alpha/beta hydrolase [Rhodospirillales bacterium]|jgi:pimeloyl-ACP methyl ester carboxylesterase|nr:alpha/beta hydrolase [Rhodospirillaceae bacterium]MDP6429831.1 alpha/beta hydrolase [Rhodospirillales bacterium]MDP6646308.1 alpha/beta hydrolase [Rhodospirillales bacterium]MDP6842627.1 alpha/beta hydrolase [Rhodospirillales bacterium]
MKAKKSVPTRHGYTSQRLQLSYVDWGNDGAPPLIMIHGGRDHARSWDWVAAELAGDYHILAVDLRGHGDSEWTNSATYMVDEFVYDVAELIHQKDLAPVTIIAHSLGGIIGLRYAGIYPDKVTKVVAIEGLGLGRPRGKLVDEKPVPERYRNWIRELRDITTWEERRYETLDGATRRMAEANAHLSPEQVRHLTEHGTKRNDDGSYSWKFDHYFFTRFAAPVGIAPGEAHEMWSNIDCPALLMRGAESWASDPEEDGNAAYFKDCTSVTVDNAAHWVHHDQLEVFLGHVRNFLAD